jgi:hypothetical protein
VLQAVGSQASCPLTVRWLGAARAVSRNVHTDLSHLRVLFRSADLVTEPQSSHDVVDRGPQLRANRFAPGPWRLGERDSGVRDHPGQDLGHSLHTRGPRILFCPNQFRTPRRRCRVDQVAVDKANRCPIHGEYDARARVR